MQKDRFARVEIKPKKIFKCLWNAICHTITSGTTLSRVDSKLMPFGRSKMITRLMESFSLLRQTQSVWTRLKIWTDEQSDQMVWAKRCQYVHMVKLNSSVIRSVHTRLESSALIGNYWLRWRRLHRPENTTLGEVSLYGWPPVYPLGFSCFAYVELATDLLVRSNPNPSNRRSTVQWYFPLWWVNSALTTNFIISVHTLKAKIHMCCLHWAAKIQPG